jgi:outer membrane scaffolding protein for murein synthesis (MipA/OmpV family)
MTRIPIRAALLAALAWPAVAAAQEAQPTPATVFDGDYLTVGIGAGYGPSYEGSDDYVVFPVPLVRGRLGGVEISPRPGGVALDLIPDPRDARLNFILGPVARVRTNRAHQIHDPVVRRLGKLDTAVEVGVDAGLKLSGVLNDYDSLTFSADVRWDVAGAHKGMVVSPSVGYFTPLSKAAAINLSVSAEHVDDDYAGYYFSVSPAGSAASGLPAFQADGGWKSIGVTLLAGLDFDGDATNGGLAGFVLGGYSRMLGDARRTPLTSIRGDADQWIGGAGLAYTF